MEAYYDKSIGMYEVFDYLSDAFYENSINATDFYTYFLSNNLFCNIVFVREETKLIGAFITEPASIDKETKFKLEQTVSSSYQSTKYKRELETLILRLPVIHSDRIQSIGIVLLELSKILSKKVPRQIILSKQERFSKVASTNRMLDRRKIYNDSFEDENLFFTFFLKISNLVRLGDVQGLTKLFHSMNTSHMPIDRIRSTDFLRTFKNQFMKTCSMACFIAIEAKAPYHKAMSITDGFGSKVEELDNISDIFHLFKMTLISITNLVAKSNVTHYSKPVHQAMDYITFHYAEKITLKKLAGHTRLSTSYLSKQIKKETGMSLVDNINRVRIEKSKEILIDENISILEAAHSVGFVYQNHFASVFRKFMNITPTAYKKSMGKANTTHKDEFLDILPIVMEQILNKDLLLSDCYQQINIINPVRQTFLRIDSKEQEFEVKEYTKKEEYDKYFIDQSYIKDQTLYQLVLKGEHIFLVIATPRRVYKTTYIIQFTIDISDCILIDKHQAVGELITLIPKLKARETIPIGELYNRAFINRNLPIEMRKSILEEKDLFLVIIMIDNLTSKKMDSLVWQSFSKVWKEALTNESDWVGNLSNNMVILVLHDIAYEDVKVQARQIQSNLETQIINEKGNLFHYNIKYGVKKYKESINDMEDFILLALKDMEQRFPYL